MNNKITYAITVCNEEEEFRKLLHQIKNNKREEDEIIVLVDVSKASEGFLQELFNYEHTNTIDFLIENSFPSFENNFAEWKNQLSLYAGNGNWIFQLDADEFISKEFLEILPELLDKNENLDMFWVPRENKVLGITQSHINKWGWQQDNLGRINYPDYQGRIYKNSPDIRWKNKVHEVLTGYKQYASLPEVPALSINHTKTIEKQEKQNNYYNTL